MNTGQCDKHFVVCPCHVEHVTQAGHSVCSASLRADVWGGHAAQRPGGVHLPALHPVLRGPVATASAGALLPKIQHNICLLGHILRLVPQRWLHGAFVQHAVTACQNEAGKSLHQ